MPHRSSVPMEWRLKRGRYGLIGSKCDSCNEIYFPSRQYCRECKKGMGQFKLSGRGTILTYTTISSAPAGFEEYAPYVVAIIKLEEGPMISAQIVDTLEVKAGQKVSSVFRKLNEDGEEGVIHYGLKFEVLES